MSRVGRLASICLTLLLASACSDNTVEGDKLIIGPDIGTIDGAGLADGGADGSGLVDVSIVGDGSDQADLTPPGDGTDGDTAVAGSDAIEVDGPLICPAGLAGCTAEGKLAICNAAGTALETKDCDAGQKCVEGKCISCTQTAECETGLTCVAGQCVAEALIITTDSLPAAFIGKAYTASVAAKGGALPYTWSVPNGSAPLGLSLAADGAITGTPTQNGLFGFVVKVTDNAGQSATKQFVIDIGDASTLTITTASPLKTATEGESYSTQFEVKGGTAPYAWLISAGTLPKGLSLSSDGKLTGTPTTDVAGKFTVKVFDSSPATLSTTKEFDLPIKLAPLQIVGSQEINLFITKVIVLPLIVVVDGIPVPYNAKLEAIGGKKPYSWKEVPLPGFVANFLGGKSGVPQGLKIATDGTVSGGVSDASLVLSLNVPVVNINLTGFFFQAQVSDSQGKPSTQEALFIIPTVPVGGP